MDETETTTQEPTDPSTSTGDDPAPTEVAPAQPAADPAPARPASKVLTMPTAKIGEIKQQERERGRREALTQLDSDAKALGYDSHEQLMTALREQAKGSPRTAQPAEASEYDTDPVAPAEPETDPALRRSRKVQQLTADRQKLLEDRRRLNKQRAHEERQRKELQSRLDAQQAEHELRFAAMRSGITDEGDVDYAVACLRKEIKGKSADELQGFDPADYFGKKLRKSKPYLYGETTREATTSPPATEAGTNGGAPAAAEPHVQTGGDDVTPVDARKLSDQDFKALLRKQGYADPSVGMPI